MADPLTVQCPSCLAPAEEACRSDLGTHADRQDAADLHAVEHGTCQLCHRPMVRGVPLVGDEVTAWHPDETDAAACPPLPDPRADWDSYALALQSGLAPGRPGMEHFIPEGAILPEPNLDAQIDALHGPGAAAALETAYADGSLFSDPHPATGTPVCPECVAGKHQNCTGEAWDYVADDLTACTCPHEEHTRG